MFLFDAVGANISTLILEFDTFLSGLDYILSRERTLKVAQNTPTRVRRVNQAHFPLLKITYIIITFGDFDTIKGKCIQI